jgi:hypothetical protein
MLVRWILDAPMADAPGYQNRAVIAQSSPPPMGGCDLASVHPSGALPPRSEQGVAIQTPLTAASWLADLNTGVKARLVIGQGKGGYPQSL